MFGAIGRAMRGRCNNWRRSHADMESSFGYSGDHSFAGSFFSCASAGASIADITLARLG